jgi:hypothetical protein
VHFAGGNEQNNDFNTSHPECKSEMLHHEPTVISIFFLDLAYLYIWFM